MSSTKFEIEKFNGKNNFELWKLKMRELLVQQGLQRAFDEKRKNPLTITDDEWEDLDAKALSTIRLCLANDVLFNIIGETSAASLWNRLENLYMTKSVTNRIYLKRQLYGMKMKEGTKIADHLNVFNNLIFQLNNMDVHIEDEDKAVNLLCTLPESWGHVISSISLSTSDTLEFDTVIGALLFEELRNKANIESSTPEALYVRGRSKEKGENSRGTSRYKSKGRKSKLKCWYCNKTGHLKKDCWKRKESNDSKFEGNSVKSDSGMIDEVLSICSVSGYNEEWLLDSGQG